MLISNAEEPGQASIHNRMISLNQPLANAEAGHQVEVIIELELMPDENHGPVVFSINRGHIGATWVELYKYDGQDWVLVDSFRWAGINQGSSNIVEFSLEYTSIFVPD